MTLKRVIPFAHDLLKTSINQGDTVIDATAGNGHDTEFLANLIGPGGRVYAFDIQEQAISNTKARLTNAQVRAQVKYIHDSHSMIHHYLMMDDVNSVQAAIFNLGYLPGGDQAVVTRPATTIAAIKQVLDLMDKGGLIVLVIYPGHPEGKQERDELLQYVQNIDPKIAGVAQYHFLNARNNPPFVIAIEKRTSH